MLMMIKLDNHIFLKKILTRLLCIISLIFLSLYEKNAFSQNYDLQKESSSNVVGSNIKVSELSKPSLGSLGVNTKANKLLGLNIWQNMNAEEIIEHLNYIPDTLASKYLQNFLNDLYLSTSVPPTGKSDEILKFLETRLFKIKNSGQSKNLYQLVTQLPNGERWKIWRKWQIEYELITRQDKKACQFINNESKVNFENFWQMARVFCLSIEGKRDQSKFIFDLIKSRGFEDQNFEVLFQTIYNETNSIDFKKIKNKIQPLHLVMMDTLKMPIRANYIAHLGIEYTDSLLSLNYLTSKARSFLLDKKINYSFVSVEQIIENYKSVADGNVDFEKAYSNFIIEPNGYNRANIWLGIINMKDEITQAKSILSIIKSETNNGRFSDVISLYLTILNDIEASSLTLELNESIKKLKVSSDPYSYPDNDLSNLILLIEGKTWDWNLIEKEKALPLIPILEKAGMLEPTDTNWLDYLKNLKEDDYKEDNYSKWDNSYNRKRFILIKSIEEAAKNDDKVLTVLLAARLIGDNPLVDFDLNNLIIIRSSLNKIGLVNLANKITQEIMTSKLVNL